MDTLLFCSARGTNPVRQVVKLVGCYAAVGGQGETRAPRAGGSAVDSGRENRRTRLVPLRLWLHGGASRGAPAVTSATSAVRSPRTCGRPLRPRVTRATLRSMADTVAHC